MNGNNIMSKCAYNMQTYIVWNPFIEQFQYKLIFYNSPASLLTQPHRLTCWCGIEKVNFVVKKRNMVKFENKAKDGFMGTTILEIINTEYKNIDTFILNNLSIEDLQKNFIEYFI